MKFSIVTGLFKGLSNTFLCENTTVLNVKSSQMLLRLSINSNVINGGVVVILISSLIGQNDPASTKLPLTYFGKKVLMHENKYT